MTPAYHNQANKESRVFLRISVISSATAAILWTIIKIKGIHSGPHGEIGGLEAAAASLTFIAIVSWIGFIGPLAFARFKKMHPDPIKPRTISQLLIFGFVAFGVAIGFVIESSQKHDESLLSALQPTIDAVRPELIISPTQKTAIRLYRPYVIVHLGAIGNAASSTQIDKGILGGGRDLTSLNMKTVVLLEDQEIEREEYLNQYSNETTFYRYRYQLWAFDIRTRTLGAYTSFEDPPFRHEYRESAPQVLSQNVFFDWADKITRP